ncbi:hypothetical protein [Nocardioides dilutus]
MTLEAILFAPFILPGRPRLASTIHEASKVMAGAGSRLAFDRHRSFVQRFEGQHEVRRATLAGGTSLVLRVGELGYGSAVLRVEAADRDALHVREELLLAEIEPIIAEFAEQEAAKQGYDAADADDGVFAVGTPLWFHRILLLAEEDQPRALRLFGEPFHVSEDVEGRVANGFTSVRWSVGEEPADAIEEVLEGLTAATEEWLMVDELSRRLADSLITSTSEGADLLTALDRAYELTGEIAMMSLALDERRRHLDNASIRVYLAAATVWRMDDSRRMLIDRAESVQNLIRLHAERVSAESDARRNNILFGFTVVTVLQSAMLIIDFATADTLELASVVRGLFGTFVLIATVATIAWYVLRGGRRGGRSDTETAMVVAAMESQLVRRARR